MDEAAHNPHAAIEAQAYERGHKFAEVELMDLRQQRDEWEERAEKAEACAVDLEEAIRDIHKAAFADNFDVTRLNDAILAASQLALSSQEPSGEARQDA